MRSPAAVVVLVVTVLCSGCPLQAIVHAFDLDERTVADWQRRAGQHCQRTYEALVEHGPVGSRQGHADEIRANGRKRIAWMALAMDATSRLGGPSRAQAVWGCMVQPDKQIPAVEVVANRAA